ncbi:36 kDa protein [Strawberry latent ringspot virus satellite RNA]|uniref:36 kDa protein n=1 Tax=Strawberry latent ringspot virus satellite RNA TaxID=195062 RepID=Q07996_9VIRU|nr:36 kDa protein [Strawberry latent ringspot virus satellite RNA]pir/JQ2018/ hypothetical 36.5K protein - strawberry latent ringspot virus [Strawberry latent ringspot virus]CAA49480.1 36 kDa protein [Strawberry latent ringspot virus satellite RNA]
MVQNSVLKGGGGVLPKRVRVISKRRARIFTVGRHDLHVLPSGKRAWVPVRAPIAAGGSFRRERPPVVSHKTQQVRPIRTPTAVKTSNRFASLSVKEEAPEAVAPFNPKKKSYADALRSSAFVKPSARKGVVTLVETEKDFALFCDEFTQNQVVPCPGQTLSEAESLQREFHKRAFAFSGKRLSVSGLPEGPIPSLLLRQSACNCPKGCHVDPVSWEGMSFGQCSRALTLYRQLCGCFGMKMFSSSLYGMAVRRFSALGKISLWQSRKILLVTGRLARIWRPSTSLYSYTSSSRFVPMIRSGTWAFFKDSLIIGSTHACVVHICSETGIEPA